MRLLDPLPWHLIAPGTVVLFPNATHAVAVYDVQHTRHPNGALTVAVLVEGWPRPIDVTGTLAQPVELDDTDAIGNMLRAGFTLTPIKEE